MKKLRLTAAAAIAGAVTLLAPGTAHAAYPADFEIYIDVSSAILYGGDEFDYEVYNNYDIECDWDVQFDAVPSGDDNVQSSTGQTQSGTFDTKAVDEIEEHPIVATCTYDDTEYQGAVTLGEGSTAPAFYSTDSGSVVQAAIVSPSAEGTITLLPRDGGDDDDDDDNGGGGGDDNGVLPDTGGDYLWLLLAGLGLVTVGGGVTYAARRR